MHNASELAKQFWSQGYLILEDFFELALMDKLHHRILEHYGATPAFEHNEEFLNKAATEVVPWFPQREGENMFDEVEHNSAFCAISEAVLGEGWRALYCMTMFSRAGSKGQAWHQDCPPEQAEKFNLNRLVYTQDITSETGGQVLIRPHTHTAGALSVGDVDETFDDQLVVAPKKGTLILLHGHCWHRVLPTNMSRISTNFRAIPQGTDEHITDICVYRNMRYQFSTSEVIEDRLV